jgi:cell wall-associated NlpC family hydrolase
MRIILISALALALQPCVAFAFPAVSAELAGNTDASNWRSSPRQGISGKTTLRHNVLQRARSQLNTMYHFGGTSPQTGFDCSGFIGWIYNGLLKHPLPRTADAMFTMDAPTVRTDALKPGDVMFYRINGGKVSHVTMYIGKRQFIHAPRPGQVLRTENMDLPYWTQRYAGAKRVLGSSIALPIAALGESAAKAQSENSPDLNPSQRIFSSNF